MRARNDWQPVLRGHGQAQGGGGRRGQRLCAAEGAPPSVQLEHGVGAEPLRLQDHVQ